MVNKGVIWMPAFLVEEALDGITVQHFLRRHCQVSARLLAKLKRTENGMTVNGQPVRSIDILHGGDVIELIFPQDNADIQPVCLPLDIIYEDDALLAVNKPPFQPVHPVHEHRTDTLANAVMYYRQNRGETYTFRAVNRLDKDTSGLVLIAKSSYAHTFLAQHTEKRYIALCEGELQGSGTIDTPIRRQEGSIIRRETGEEGRPSVTHYTVLQTAFGHTLLSVWLETGRTHQIRTHFASIGHPLAGDDLYGGHRTIFRRQCLHCAALTFVHPLTRETIRLQCAPEDWLFQFTHGSEMELRQCFTSDFFEG